MFPSATENSLTNCRNEVEIFTGLDPYRTSEVNEPFDMRTQGNPVAMNLAVRDGDPATLPRPNHA
jgi:hypothetical protein